MSELVEREYQSALMRLNHAATELELARNALDARARAHSDALQLFEHWQSFVSKSAAEPK